MKNENNIDNFFDRVKQNPPLIPIEKVHQIINSPKAKARLKGNNRNLLKFTIMTTIFAVIVSAILFWPGRKAENSIKIKDMNQNEINLLVNSNQRDYDLIKTALIPTELKISENEILSSISIENETGNSDNVQPDNSTLTEQKNKTFPLIAEKDTNGESESAFKKDQKTEWKSDNFKTQGKIYQEQILDSTISIELTKNQLETFGFASTDTSLELVFQVDGRIMATIITNGSSSICVDVDGYNKWEHATKKYVNPSKSNDLNENIIPILITDKEGQGWLKLRLTEDLKRQLFSVKLAKDYRTLIPIIIKKNTFKSQPISDKIFWFLPTDEFFNRLPPEISNGFLKEYNYITAEDKSTLAKPECKYFEECKNTLVLTNFKAYPNPAQNQLSVSFELPDAINGRISLVDLAGRERQVLHQQSQFAAGSHQFDFDLSSVAEGIYLLTLYSDKGVQTQRLMVVR